MDGGSLDFEREYGNKGPSRRDCTYRLLAKEKDWSVAETIIYLCEKSGLNPANATIYAYTLPAMEKLAGLELFKIYQQDPSKKYLAVYARDAIETAFNL
ncbi:hypothetical protein LCGC14_0143580 [marine sediment metagenome]|uniref:Uncharacterized protein n=1 Tax=marine sediment metagenome TaxID=412755 RepID=A0A0F9V3V4_9ZZZZ